MIFFAVKALQPTTDEEIMLLNCGVCLPDELHKYDSGYVGLSSLFQVSPSKNLFVAKDI